MAEEYPLAAAKERLRKAKRAYETARSEFIIADEAYSELVSKWWRDAIKRSEEKPKARP